MTRELEQCVDMGQTNVFDGGTLEVDDVTAIGRPCGLTNVPASTSGGQLGSAPTASVGGRTEGVADTSRRVVDLGEAQWRTQVGTRPLPVERDAGSLGEAPEKFAAGAKVAVERAVKALQELCREVASPIIMPDSVPPGLGRPARERQ